jgi:hypothetical protein
MNAQYREKALPRYAISLEPLYIANCGLRMNFEYRPAKKHSLELSLMPYYFPGDDDDYGNIIANSTFDDFYSLAGLGAGFGYKYYFASLFFISPNISYTRYNVKYHGLEYNQFEEDGLKYYYYGKTLVKQSFDKFTACITLGSRTPYRRAFFIEYYAGIGLAHSIYDTNKKAYDELMFGYGYSGVYLTTGIKLAFNIR